jgi:hypothetical protein
MKQFGEDRERPAQQSLARQGQAGFDSSAASFANT